jgi:hypothetical protein
MKINRYRIIWLAVLTSVFACATVSLAKKKVVEPDFVDPSFHPESVEALVVYSAVDLRKDKGIEFEDLDKIVHGGVKAALRKGVYTLEYRSGFGGKIHDVTEDDLEYLEDSWIRELGGGTDRWVLLMALEDLAKKKTYGGLFGAQCSGYLFDTEQGKVVWRHATAASQGQGGLLGMGMRKTIRNSTVSMCVSQALRTLPGHKKAKKK